LTDAWELMLARLGWALPNLRQTPRFKSTSISSLLQD
jgi:hypothetical protein